MNFIEIKVSELDSFINSTEFLQMKELPLSGIRAKSQFINPCAAPDDIALIYAIDDQKKVVGYIGIIPARAYSPETSKIYFISCWWSDGQAGRGIAMKLFFRMLEITHSKVFFFHLPEKMEAILKAMGGFNLPASINGIKGFVRWDNAGWFIRRNPGLKILKPLLQLSDKLMNMARSPILASRIQKLIQTTSIKAEIISEPESQEIELISECNKLSVVFRGMAEIMWAMSNPWISTDFGSYSNEAARYRFSLLARDWQQQWVRMRKADKLIGVAFINIRDGVVTVPYIWYKSADDSEVLRCLLILFHDLKVRAIQLYNPALIKGFGNINKFFIYSRPLKRIIAWPHEMDSLMNKGFILQDGDGDALFT